jgi:hypothetical protein
MDPLTVSPAAIPSAEARSRHGRPRFLGFSPSESPWRPRMCLAHGALDAPLGFALLGSRDKSLDRDFARPPLTRLPVGRTDERRLRVSISLCPRLILPRGQLPRVCMRPPFEGFRTGRVLNIRTSRRPGYVFTSRSTAHYCARHRALWTEQALPELSGTALGAEPRDLHVALLVYTTKSRRATTFHAIAKCNMYDSQPRVNSSSRGLNGLRTAHGSHPHAVFREVFFFSQGGAVSSQLSAVSQRRECAGESPRRARESGYELATANSPPTPRAGCARPF